MKAKTVVVSSVIAWNMAMAADLLMPSTIQTAHADPVFGDYCSQTHPYPPPAAVGNVCTRIGIAGGFGSEMCDPSNPVFTHCPWAEGPSYGPVTPSSPGLTVNPRTGTF